MDSFISKKNLDNDSLKVEKKSINTNFDNGLNNIKDSESINIENDLTKITNNFNENMSISQKIDMEYDIPSSEIKMTIIKTPDNKTQIIDTCLLNTLKDSRDRIVVLRMEQELLRFLNQEEKQYLQFPPMTSYHRLIVHRCAEYFQLGNHVEQSDDGNWIIKLYKTTSTKKCFIKLKDIPIEETNNNTVLKIMKRQSNQENVQNGEFVVVDDITKTEISNIDDLKNNYESTLQSNSNHNENDEDIEERQKNYQKARARIFCEETNVDFDDTSDDYIEGYEEEMININEIIDEIDDSVTDILLKKKKLKNKKILINENTFPLGISDSEKDDYDRNKNYKKNAIPLTNHPINNINFNKINKHSTPQTLSRSRMNNYQHIQSIPKPTVFDTNISQTKTFYSQNQNSGLFNSLPNNYIQNLHSKDSNNKFSSNIPNNSQKILNQQYGYGNILNNNFENQKSTTNNEIFNYLKSEELQNRNMSNQSQYSNIFNGSFDSDEIINKSENIPTLPLYFEVCDLPKGTPNYQADIILEPLKKQGARIFYLTDCVIVAMFPSVEIASYCYQLYSKSNTKNQFSLRYWNKSLHNIS